VQEALELGCGGRAAGGGEASVQEASQQAWSGSTCQHQEWQYVPAPGVAVRASIRSGSTCQHQAAAPSEVLMMDTSSGACHASGAWACSHTCHASGAWACRLTAAVCRPTQDKQWCATGLHRFTCQAFRHGSRERSDATSCMCCQLRQLSPSTGSTHFCRAAHQGTRHKAQGTKPPAVIDTTTSHPPARLTPRGSSTSSSRMAAGIQIMDHSSRRSWGSSPPSGVAPGPLPPAAAAAGVAMGLLIGSAVGAGR
jgi:hypothetical protein